MDWKKVIQQAYSHGKAAGLTQNEIARRTGAHQKQISQLVTGKVEPRLGFAFRFFEAVGLEIRLGNITDKQPKQTVYVILNQEGQMYSGITDTHELWTVFITEAALFNNATLARRTNDNFKLGGTVIKMRHSFELI